MWQFGIWYTTMTITPVLSAIVAASSMYSSSCGGGFGPPPWVRSSLQPPVKTAVAVPRDVSFCGMTTATWCVQMLPLGPMASLVVSQDWEVTLRMCAVLLRSGNFTVTPVSCHL